MSNAEREAKAEATYNLIYGIGIPVVLCAACAWILRLLRQSNETIHPASGKLNKAPWV